MKCTLKQDELKTALKHLKQAVPSKAALPILENLLVKVNKKEATLIATDLSLTIIYKVSCEADEAFELLIPFNMFNDIVNISIADITIEKKRNHPIITCLFDRFDLGNTDAIDEFPKIPVVKEKNKMELNGTLIDNLNRATLTVGKDELKPVLTNICLDFKPKSLTIVSTDGFQLFKKHFDISYDTNESLLISPKIARAMEGFVTTKISFNKNYISFDSENITVIAQRMEEKYVNYSAVIPVNEMNGSFKAEDMTAALDSCVVPDTASNETLFTLSKDHFDMENKSEDTGRSASTKLNVEYAGEVGEIKLSADRLKICMSQLKGFENLKMSIHKPDKPILISPEGDASLTILLIPVIYN